ncbi:MAG: hypothetical protein N3D82_01460 [Ignisphaera sp.]|nr:hypothetical protein [Ignisphaera sp.]MCX8167685.1 hypothetical protein [Ignisphaera sp.]MDW8085675.1 hypothetical protein [Ignisphaera sp.]
MELEKLGFALILVGMIMAFTATIIPLFIALSAGNVEVSGGGCIVLFFVPVCFGYGEFALQLIILAIALAIVLAAVSFVIHRMTAASLKSDRAIHV